tara:strand:+ start:126 stop:557 length:432 start_codon:yes stop_codon:yes gene_type:complete
VIALFLLASMSWARGAELVRPSPPDIPPTECSESFPLRYQMKIPGALSDNGIARCSAVAVPTSTVAHLLQFKEYAIGLEEVCRLDAQRCAADRALMEAEITELSRPQPWAESPRAARWLGRIETAILASLIVGGYVAVDRSLR